MCDTDYLDLDDEVPGQRYVCLSFLSPEKVLELKEVYVFSRFVESRCAALSSMLTELSELGGEYAAKASLFRERHEGWLDASKTSLEYDAYVMDNEELLNREFAERNDFLTCVRGIKVRGSYDTLAEAHARCEAIKRLDDRFDVYVGTVGAWCPWDPSPESIKDVEYSETELNTLMKKYKENHESRGKAYSESTASKVAAAIAEGKANVVKGEVVASASASASAAGGEECPSPSALMGSMQDS